jgi:hypothetical protein
MVITDCGGEGAGGVGGEGGAGGAGAGGLGFGVGGGVGFGVGSGVGGGVGDGAAKIHMSYWLPNTFVHSFKWMFFLRQQLPSPQSLQSGVPTKMPVQSEVFSHIAWHSLAENSPSGYSSMSKAPLFVEQLNPLYGVQVATGDGIGIGDGDGVGDGDGDGDGVGDGDRRRWP